MSEPKADGGAAVHCISLLAFPARHHFDCGIDRCSICLDDHAALSRYIESITQAPARLHDFLGEYRKWLDDKRIPAEGYDGWATREAWDIANVHAFIADNWGIDANAERASGASPSAAASGST